MARKSYPTDLNDMEWEILAPLIPPPKEGGHPRTTDMRAVCNAIYYHLKTGCQWNMLPGDFVILAQKLHLFPKGLILPLSQALQKLWQL